jgi:hypothetical protein
MQMHVSMCKTFHKPLQREGGGAGRGGGGGGNYGWSVNVRRGLVDRIWCVWIYVFVFLSMGKGGKREGEREMYIHTCVYVCVCVNVCVCMYVCMCVYICDIDVYIRMI